MTSPKIKDSPSASCRIIMSGGLIKPVAQGDIRRTIQPLGVSKNAKPNAIVTCGTESNGDKNL